MHSDYTPTIKYCPKYVIPLMRNSNDDKRLISALCYFVSLSVFLRQTRVINTIATYLIDASVCLIVTRACHSCGFI